MNLLDSAHFFDRFLPESHAGLLELLARIEALTRGPKETKSQRCREAEALYVELLRRAVPAEETFPPEYQLDAPEFKRWFAEAVLLWLALGQTSSAPLIDSVGARSMQSFPLDAPVDASAAASVERALCQAFGFGDQAFRSLRSGLDHVTSNLTFKHQLTSALAEYLDQPGRLSDSGRVLLMRAFYGEVPFLPGEIDLLLTTTSLSFFIPRQGKRLEGSAWESRDPAEQDRVRAFLAKLDAANVAETRRFPSFGYHDRAALDPELIAHLALRLGAPESVVVDTLVTMYSVVPTRLREQYLVHDTWGHTWEEALHEFEVEYELLPRIDEALTPEAGASFVEPGAQHDRATLRQAFVREDGRTTLDARSWKSSVEADLRDRIRVGITCALSEVFADYMESKYSRARPHDALPTSSLIGSRSLKVDLSIADLRRQVLRAGEPYRNLATSAEARHAFRTALALEAPDDPGLDAALDQALTILRDDYLPLLETDLSAGTGVGGQVNSTLYRRALIQIVLLMAQLEQVLAFAEDGVERAWQDPATCSDLYAIALAHFYEQDRGRNFWHLDQVVRESLTPAVNQLAAALREVLGAR